MKIKVVKEVDVEKACEIATEGGGYYDTTIVGEYYLKIRGTSFRQLVFAGDVLRSQDYERRVTTLVDIINGTTNTSN